MIIACSLLAFFLGGCFVSCGNCIHYRILHDMDWVRGHSVCEHCGKRLSAWDMIPVISCLILKGRCRRCGYFFGYSHAMSEAVGGFACSLFCLVYDDFSQMLTAVFVAGCLYCFCNYIDAKRTYRRRH